MNYKFCEHCGKTHDEHGNIIETPPFRFTLGDAAALILLLSVSCGLLYGGYRLIRLILD